MLRSKRVFLSSIIFSFLCFGQDNKTEDDIVLNNFVESLGLDYFAQFYKKDIKKVNVNHGPKPRKLPEKYVTGMVYFFHTKEGSSLGPEQIYDHLKRSPLYLIDRLKNSQDLMYIYYNGSLYKFTIQQSNRVLFIHNLYSCQNPDGDIVIEVRKNIK